MDGYSCYSPKEKMVVKAFIEGISPRKLILDRTGEKLFNDKYGIYPEAGVSLYNFTRDDDIIVEEENNNELFHILSEWIKYVLIFLDDY